ncbi:MAG: TIGR04190 family B12-binding domain/radical SAM domain protein, partial [Methanomassiliicoccales archaeon]
GWVIRSVIRHLDLNGFKPFRDWDRYPLTAVFSARGCTMNCAICGGSCSAMRSVFCRKRPAYRSPELLALDVYNIYCHLKSPIFIVGDLRQGGKDYPERFFNEVKKLGVENHIVLEIFTPAQNEFFSMASKSLGSYSVQFSPDSQDEKVRYALGRCFDNASLESTVLKSFKHGCKRFDLFFMIGLPQQTLASVFAIADYIDHFYRTIESAEKEKLFFYASPLAPFLDPGSQAFENPEVYGYRLFARTLEDHRVRLLNPSWKDVLSYETIWMTRSEIVRSSYDVAERINARRFESGLISREAYESLVDRITLARKLDAKIESIMLIRDMQERRNQLQSLRDEVRALMESTICKKRDLEWEAEGILRSVPRALFGILKGKKMR